MKEKQSKYSELSPFKSDTLWPDRDFAGLGSGGGIHGQEQPTISGAEKLRQRVEHRVPAVARARAEREKVELCQGQLVQIIDELRDQKGLSQTAVADAMGTTQSAISRMASGKNSATLSTILRYGLVLGYEPSSFLSLLADKLKDTQEPEHMVNLGDILSDEF